jgi:hypothetical protein
MLLVPLALAATPLLALAFANFWSIWGREADSAMAPGNETAQTPVRHRGSK